MSYHYTIASHRANLSSERCPILAGIGTQLLSNLWTTSFPLSIFVDRFVPLVVSKGAWFLKSGRGEFKTQCFVTCIFLSFSGLGVLIHKNGCCNNALVGSL